MLLWTVESMQRPIITDRHKTEYNLYNHYFYLVKLSKIWSIEPSFEIWWTQPFYSRQDTGISWVVTLKLLDLKTKQKDYS